MHKARKIHGENYRKGISCRSAVASSKARLATSVLSAELNGMLCQGSDTAANLMGILPRFWKDLIVISADAEEMRFSNFVAHRPGVIHEYTTQSQWGHVQPKDKIADLASRGLFSESKLAI